MPTLNHPFRLIVFDWDGTAVMSRREDARAVSQRLERLLELGVWIAVVTGTNFANVDRQLGAAIHGPHKRRLIVGTNRGSEVYGFDEQSRPVRLWLRTATAEEDRLLTAIADRIRDTVVGRTGLPVEVVYDRLNRRKIDLIPLPEWRDPPKSAIGELLEAVDRRLGGAGIPGGLGEVLRLAGETARELGMPEARITSDVKHVEVGLTDKGDAAEWVMAEVAEREGIPPRDVLIAGDEFGPLDDWPGSDAKMITPRTREAVFVSVGVEPTGVPPGVIHLPGGPARFLELLDEQVRLHEARLVGKHTGATGDEIAAPASAFDLSPAPGWELVEECFDPLREHEVESILAIANGYLGTRGALAEGTFASSPATFVAGVFDSGPAAHANPELVVAPNWLRLGVTVEGEPVRVDVGELVEHRRRLDLRRGLWRRDWRHRDAAGRITRLTELRFVSLADRHAAVQWLRLVPENFGGRVEVEAIVDGQVSNAGIAYLEPAPPAHSAVPLLVMRTRRSEIVLADAAATRPTALPDGPVEHAVSASPTAVTERWGWQAELGRPAEIARLVAVHTSRDSRRPAGMASEHLDRLLAAGPEALLAAHVAAWDRRWQAADVEIGGDPSAQRALRFAIYHLIAAANPQDERVSVGARALAGTSYKGHVFWDTEIFMLPFYTYTNPPAARALLMYRFHTLPAARARARDLGYSGALFAWESAADGEETTPRFVITPEGELVPILCGMQEHHISADVAYAVWRYWRATGDDEFFERAGAEMVIEAARFWASRARLGTDGCYHIHKVIGPDEYHEAVDDNAYTSMMARSSLDRGVETAAYLQAEWPERWAVLSNRIDLAPDEPGQWEQVARHLYVGSDPATGVVEQFAGYFRLNEIDLQALEPRTVPIDVLLGRDVVRASKTIKQADVVMLLHLLWDQFPPEVRRANFDYYAPRTAHGSSLSPGTHALVAARLGKTELAERYFRQAAEIDLGGRGMASGGVHAAALGCLWQAAVFGFAGLHAHDDGLVFEPHLPQSWQTLRFPICWRGQQLEISVQREPPVVEVSLSGREPVAIAAGEEQRRQIRPGERLRSRQVDGDWGPWEEVR